MSNPYHEHLDVCPRCAREPFNLCAVGAAALQREAFGDGAMVPREPVPSPPVEPAREERCSYCGTPVAGDYVEVTDIQHRNTKETT